ncbi:hypothetical protein [Flavisolibacter nicotianae]|uniref:hypothetical protein n=1 Tax=Flavisolibacter nicotianae TaxID=2364882 RepID=UPI000EACD29E|nr:hypothetical protein [Flavisolibacter nicotianae]
MKKWIIVLLLVLGVAYFTKPDDKTCIIEGTRAVWGDLVPDVNDKPAMFEQFMNVISTNVVVKDWVFFKQVRYKVKTEQRTIAFGAFKNVFTTVKPMRTRDVIPKMPGRS